MHSKKNIVINCSNLHKGGGVTVASSFIDSLSQREYKEFNIYLLLSESVNNNITQSNINFSKFKAVKIVNNFGFAMFFFNYYKHFKDIDIVFSVFGPTFHLKHKHKHIIGLADPYIIYEDNPYLKKIANKRSKLKTKLLYFFKKKFLFNADSFIVEIERVKDEMSNKRIFKDKDIYVVSNTINEVFLDKEKWSPIILKTRGKSLKLGIISRKYKHKNLDILPYVREVLEKRYKIRTDIFVTLNQDEWFNTSLFFKENITNVGPLLINQCPSFYKQVDGIIMPTLLEAMSVSPLETMYMSKPLFCSDFNFMHDSCDKYAIYFDPFNPNDIAEKINNYFLMDKSKKQKWLSEAKDYMSKFPNAKKRCDEYMKILSINI